MKTLLKKRVTRSALAVAAAASLAGSVVVAQGVGAQTTTLQPVTTSLAFSGPVPSGVTGVLVTVTCGGLAGITGTQTQTAQFGTSGGTTALSFPLVATTTAGTGSNCTLSARPTGTANLTLGSASFAVGGVNRTPVTSTAVAGPPAYNLFSVGPLAIDRATTVAVTFTYPSITVRKVVNGDEPVAGFAYPFVINCARPSTVSGVFIAGLAGNAVPTGYQSGQLVVPDNGFVQVGATRYNDKQDVSVATIGATAQAALITEISRLTAGSAVPPAGAPLPGGTTPQVAGGFNGTFTLTATGATASRTFGINEFPSMTADTRCEVRETNSQGSALAYSSTNGNLPGTTTPAPALPGVLVGGNFQSGLTQANGQTVTVTNSFNGELYVSKVVTGDPKTNIGIYEISVACDKGGPKETFTLRDRQTKVYTGIATGTNCLVTETRSDGAEASYTDNSGDNTTDGRVTIRLKTSNPDSLASVIVTNSYVVTTTTAAPTTAAPTTAAPVTTAAPATAAPEVEAAPAPEVESEPTFTG